jgi:hypothetical protein
LREASLECGQLCFGCGEKRRGLFDVEVARETAFVAAAGELDDTLLSRDVLSRDVEGFLVRTRIDVIARDLGENGNEHVAPGVLRCANFGARATAQQSDCRSR